MDSGITDHERLKEQDKLHAELAEALLRIVWHRLNFASCEAMIVSEAIRRLSKQ